MQKEHRLLESGSLFGEDACAGTRVSAPTNGSISSSCVVVANNTGQTGGSVDAGSKQSVESSHLAVLCASRANRAGAYATGRNDRSADYMVR